jgi:Family of unknown function (DUF5681)
VVEIAAATAHIMGKRSVVPATAVAPKASRLEEVVWFAGETVWSFGPEGAFTTGVCSIGWQLGARMLEKTDTKQGARFRKGQSGNPSGRPRGARNKTTLAVEALLDGEAEALTRKAIERAKEGDSVALRLCLERILPPRKDRPVSFALPKIESAADAGKASTAILTAVATGDVTPLEAEAVLRLLEGHAKVLEVRDLEERIATLELKAGSHVEQKEAP